MSLFPDNPKKIKARIRNYERSLQKEREEHGFINDGYGKRYLLGPLYMLVYDNEGALQSYAWFETQFPDDVGEPMQYLCWTLSLYHVVIWKQLPQNFVKQCYLTFTSFLI